MRASKQILRNLAAGFQMMWMDKVVQVKSTSALLEKFTELASKIVLGKCYDSKLKPVADPGYAMSCSSY
jgi:hypothetical protein